MSAEAWPCRSLACCVTLGKFLDLSEPEDPGVSEGGPRAWPLRATGTIAYCSFLWSPRHSGARSAATPLRGWAHSALCGHRHGTLSHASACSLSLLGSFQEPGGVWAAERLGMPWLETGLLS